MHKLVKSPGKKPISAKPTPKSCRKSKAPFFHEPTHATAKRSKPGAAPSGKIAHMLSLLRSAKGASVADLSKATGWQAHSIRGALSRAIGKKLKIRIASEKLDGVRIYRAAN